MSDSLVRLKTIREKLGDGELRRILKLLFEKMLTANDEKTLNNLNSNIPNLLGALDNDENDKKLFIIEKGKEFNRTQLTCLSAIIGINGVISIDPSKGHSNEGANDYRLMIKWVIEDDLGSISRFCFGKFFCNVDGKVVENVIDCIFGNREDLRIEPWLELFVIILGQNIQDVPSYLFDNGTPEMHLLWMSLASSDPLKSIKKYLVHNAIAIKLGMPIFNKDSVAHDITEWINLPVDCWSKCRIFTADELKGCDVFLNDVKCAVLGAIDPEKSSRVYSFFTNMFTNNEIETFTEYRILDCLQMIGWLDEHQKMWLGEIWENTSSFELGLDIDLNGQ